MRARISGLAAYYPETIRTNADWPADFGRRADGFDRTFNDIPLPDDEAARVTERHLRAESADPFLGCERRHIAPDSLTSSEAEARAAERALADAGVAGEDVDYVLSYSITPEIPSPPSGCIVAQRVGARRATAVGVESACATPLVQLATAAGLIEAGLARTVLLTQSHLLLRAMPMLHPATPGLGDAATACVVTDGGRGLEILTVHAMTHGEFFESVLMTRAKDDEPLWFKKGGDFRLGTHDPPGAKALMRDTVSFGARTLRETCAKAGIAPGRIDVFASVQPRAWVPPSILEVLGVPGERAVTTYRERGHLGASGVIANLEAARAQGAISSGAIVALYAQGAGFTRSGALLRA